MKTATKIAEYQVKMIFVENNRSIRTIGTKSNWLRKVFAFWI